MNAPLRPCNVLFVTWDGPGSSFLAGLFLPIFEALRSSNYQFHVLQFTWADQQERSELAAACRDRGIPYRSASIWRKPVALGSLAAVLSGAWPIRRSIKEWEIDLVMPRSTLPATAARWAEIIGRSRLPMLFDADGLPHDERIELGDGNSKDLIYRVLRLLEKHAVQRADAITVRTKLAATILTKRAGQSSRHERFHIVANARDANQFRPLDSGKRSEIRKRINVPPEQPLIVYVASVLGWKNRPQAMFRFFSKVRQRRPDARLLLVLPDGRETAKALEDHPDIAANCISRSATPADVAGWIGASDLGMALMHTSFSMQAVAPIKIGEYLLCGVPVLTSTGVGDFDTLIDAGTGLTIGEPTEAALEAAADWFVQTVLPNRNVFSDRCRALGIARFSLESAVGAYRAALDAALAASR